MFSGMGEDGPLGTRRTKGETRHNMELPWLPKRKTAQFWVDIGSLLKRVLRLKDFCPCLPRKELGKEFSQLLRVALPNCTL